MTPEMQVAFDRLTKGSNTRVTFRMRRAGADVLRQIYYIVPDECVAEWVYAAMAAEAE